MDALMSNALVDVFVRFDIIGLSPDSQEDEAGIKQAAENGMLRSIFYVLKALPGVLENELSIWNRFSKDNIFRENKVLLSLTKI